MLGKEEAAVQALWHFEQYTMNFRRSMACLCREPLPFSYQFQIMNSDVRRSAVQFVFLARTATLSRARDKLRSSPLFQLVELSVLPAIIKSPFQIEKVSNYIPSHLWNDRRRCHT